MSNKKNAFIVANMTDETLLATDFVKINRRLWNDKVPYHVASSMYDVQGFLAGGSSLNKIELNLLGDLRGKRILHLQCHFGLDSLSLIRHGAEHVTGVDLSDKAIEQAQTLAKRLDLDSAARFICCNLYDLSDHLSSDPEQLFDIVFTSYGVIGWLPDLNEWAALIVRYLKRNGCFIMVEFHPVFCMFNQQFTHLEESYFNRRTIVSQCHGSYADRYAPIVNPSVEWNHSLSEVFQALLRHHLRLDAFEEFDYSPYDCFENSVQTDEGFYQIKGFEKKIPMIFALKATKSI